MATAPTPTVAVRPAAAPAAAAPAPVPAPKPAAPAPAEGVLNPPASEAERAISARTKAEQERGAKAISGRAAAPALKAE